MRGKPEPQLVGGNPTAALDWPIDKNCYVLEIGGYKGRWAFDMFQKFRCRIDIFEPQPWAWHRILTQFSDSIYTDEEIDRVQMYNVALWHSYQKIFLYDAETDGGTLVKRGRNTDNNRMRVQAVDAYDLLRRCYYDVVLMNIEGGEYILVPHLCRTGIIKNFRFFWMQHHEFADPDKNHLNNIRKMMLKTHDKHWEYGSFICWRRRDDYYKESVEN